MFCGECGSSTSATPQSRTRTDSVTNDTTIIQPLPPQSAVFSVPYQMVPDALPVEPDPVALPPAPVAAAPFVLEFSTGESVAVLGSGLLGRRPIAQEGETFDNLVQIHDVGMSVSKCHLEFGQYDGEFWVADRFSGNGTVIRNADDSAIQCEPGRRYLVPRGTRVEIADQFFVLV